LTNSLFYQSADFGASADLLGVRLRVNHPELQSFWLMDQNLAQRCFGPAFFLRRIMSAELMTIRVSQVHSEDLP
jgi:hypothetical protein